VFPHARFLGKIPEQSEDDFSQNRFSGSTLLVESEHGTIFAQESGRQGVFFLSPFTFLEKRKHSFLLCFYFS
jgi:hypothetical protein